VIPERKTLLPTSNTNLSVLLTSLRRSRLWISVTWSTTYKWTCKVRHVVIMTLIHALMLPIAFKEIQKAKKSASTGPTLAKVKIPPRPRQDNASVATPAQEGESDVDEALLAELNDSEGDDDMDVDDRR
jgi:hypothetical protein